MHYDPEPAARVAYAAVRQIREEQGCPRGPVWNLLLREEKSWYVRHAERALMGLTSEQIQDAWRIDLTESDLGERSWRSGPEIDHVKRTHPELAEWEYLEERYRRRFFIIQMMALSYYVPITTPAGDSPSVTGL